MRLPFAMGAVVDAEPGRQSPLSGQISPVLALVPRGLRFSCAFTLLPRTRDGKVPTVRSATVPGTGDMLPSVLQLVNYESLECYMEEKSLFAQRLKHARERLRGLNQAELASLAGLPQTAISHFESDARKPSFDSLRRLSTALEVTSDWLMGRSDEPGAAPTTNQLHRDLQNMTPDDLSTVEALVKLLAEKSAKKTGD